MVTSEELKQLFGLWYFTGCMVHYYQNKAITEDTISNSCQRWCFLKRQNAYNENLPISLARLLWA